MFFTNSFFEVINISKNVQIYSSKFDGLLHGLVSNETFINQQNSYINKNDEMNYSTVSDYTTEVLSIKEIEKKKDQVKKIEDTNFISY